MKGLVEGNFEYGVSYNCGNRVHIILSAFTWCVKSFPSRFEKTVNIGFLSSTKAI